MKENNSNTQRGFTFVEGLLIVVLVGIVGFAGWYVYDSNQKTNSIYDKSGSLESATNYKKQSTQTSGDKEKSSSSPITDELRQNVSDSIKSDNTAALEGYMTDNVAVVIAASEKGGLEPKVDAIKDLEYLSSATDPWDFDLSMGTLNSYKAGFYEKYFSGNVIVGKSADGKVVAFGVNDSGKIDTIFMAANADLLTE